MHRASGLLVMHGGHLTLRAHLHIAVALHKVQYLPRKFGYKLHWLAAVRTGGSGEDAVYSQETQTLVPAIQYQSSPRAENTEIWPSLSALFIYAYTVFVPVFGIADHFIKIRFIELSIS